MDAVSDSSRTAVVDRRLVYKKIDENTPRNQKMILINRNAGDATTGTLTHGDKFYTHWFPLPVFGDDDADQ